jgi:SagB-type dehydrogenase family enzyme
MSWLKMKAINSTFKKVNRRKFLKAFLGVIAALIASFLYAFQKHFKQEAFNEKALINQVKPLEKPFSIGFMSVEEAISKRRSIRGYSKAPLTFQELSQLLWAAQGITDLKTGFRAAPSAGATYPLEVYVVIGNEGVSGLEAGIYHYNPLTNELKLIVKGDFRNELSSAALEQRWVKTAPVNIVLTAVYERTTRVYGDRGIRYVHMEVGHVSENIYLQATALGLGTVTVGAFNDELVQKILTLPKEQKPLYIMPVGRKP